MNLYKLNGNAVDSELQLSNTPLKENFEFTEFESLRLLRTFFHHVTSAVICQLVRSNQNKKKTRSLNYKK